MPKLNAKQLRDLEENVTIAPVSRNPIYFILDNIYDTYNIGGIFRLADAVAAEKVFLCGDTETPPNHRIKKASVGTYKVVPWEYKKSAVEAITYLKSKKTDYRMTNWLDSSDLPACRRGRGGAQSAKGGRARPLESRSKTMSHSISPQIIAIEQHQKAVNYTEFNYQFPIAFILGNETDGVSEQTLQKADSIVQLPMMGINKSLNVIVAAAVVMYHALGVRIRKIE